VLWYTISDAGAGYHTLGRVAGTVTVTFRGRVVQQDTLPRHRKQSELFTDTNGLILTRFKAASAGPYTLRLSLTSLPHPLEIAGSGVQVFKLAEER